MCELEDLRVAVATTCYLDTNGSIGDFVDEREDVWIDTNEAMTQGPYWCDNCDTYFKRPEAALMHAGVARAA